MEQPNFESMSNRELIDYHLEQNQQSDALSVYVRRLNRDPKTAWVKPEESMEEFDKLMQSLSSENKNKF